MSNWDLDLYRCVKTQRLDLQIITTTNRSGVFGSVVKTDFVIETEFAVRHATEIAFHYNPANNMGGENMA